MTGRPIHHCWFHVRIWLKGHWLHGDRRGFRTVDHRIHSSGDYKHRPPAGEHAGLHRHMRGRLKHKPFAFSPDQRSLARERWLKWLTGRDYPVAALSVNGAHTHLLAKLPGDDPIATLGWGKKYVSQAMSKVDSAVPSSLFAARGKPKLVRDIDHLRKAWKYILDHADEGAAVWGAAREDLEKLWRGWAI